jgi:hypothetical protein
MRQFVSFTPRVTTLFPALTALCAVAWMVGAAPTAARGQTFGNKIGVELDGMGGIVFVDAAKELRSFEGPKGEKIDKDEFGWPKADARSVIFDFRPIPAWAPPLDDPEARQMECSGTYKMSFNGQATITAAEEPEDWSIENQKFDAASNTTTADVIMKKGNGLMFMVFTHTKRTPDAAEGTGLTNLKMIRPGYPADTKQTFTNDYLKALAPFAVLRMMDFTQTNDHAPHNGFYPGTIKWADRKLPTDCTQLEDGGKMGTAWEYVIELANTTGKDIWINVPAEADEDFIRELAKLLKAGLKPDIKVYVEHSNEVWNWIFYQAVYDKMACDAEIAKGGSNLASDGKTDTEIVRVRWHARRLITIGNIFADVFGKDQLNTRIRPVLSWWVIQPAEYAQALDWVNTNYGPPKDHFWAVASTAYFNPSHNMDGNVDQLLAALRTSCDDCNQYWAGIDKVAQQYGLKHVIYEGGPDVSRPDNQTGNVGNRIMANRDPRIGDIVKYQIKTNWFGGPDDRDLFMYFSICGLPSRYGCWGALEDITKLDTPKYQALLELTGYKAATTQP